MKMRTAHSIRMALVLYIFFILFGAFRLFAAPASSADKINLTDSWKFSVDADETGLEKGYDKPNLDIAAWRNIKVGVPYENQGIIQKNQKYDGELPYNGISWYCRDILIPKDWEKSDLIVNLGTIDDSSKIWFNGNVIGESENVDSPTEFKIKHDFVKYGEQNRISIRIKDIRLSGGMTVGSPYIRRMSKWETIKLDIKTPRYNVYYKDEEVKFDITVSEISGVSELEVICKIMDIDLTPIANQKIQIAISQNPAVVSSASVNLKQLPVGWYGIDLSVEENGNIMATIPFSFVVFSGDVKFEEPDKSPFALCGGSLFHITTEEHKTIGERRLALHRLCGAVYGRNDLWWHEIEKEKGKFDFEKSDSAVALFQKHDINLLGILCYASKWSVDFKAPSTDSELDEYINYVKTIVSRYKGKIKYWEVWNEPNLDEFWKPKPNADDYSKMLKRAYTEIKKIDPEIKVIGMVTSLCDVEFVGKCLKNGCGAYMDVISVHPYQDPSPPTDMSSEIGKIYKLKNLLSEYKLTTPIWITECGWQTNNKPARLQASYLVKYYVDLFSRNIVDRIYWFNLDDWQTRGSSQCCQYGILYIDMSPKPSYASYHFMTEMLHDFTEIIALKNTPDGISGYRASFKNKQPVYIFWSEKGSQVLGCSEDTKKAFDIYGREKPILDGKIEVSTEPCFLIKE